MNVIIILGNENKLWMFCINNIVIIYWSSKNYECLPFMYMEPIVTCLGLMSRVTALFGQNTSVYRTSHAHD